MTLIEQRGIQKSLKILCYLQTQRRDRIKPQTSTVQIVWQTFSEKFDIQPRYQPAALLVDNFTLDAGLLARSQYSEGPANGHVDTGFSWFPCA